MLDCDLSRRRRLDRVLDGALASEQVAAELGDAELRARSIIVAAEAAALLGRPAAAADGAAPVPAASRSGWCRPAPRLRRGGHRHRRRDGRRGDGWRRRPPPWPRASRRARRWSPGRPARCSASVSPSWTSTSPCRHGPREVLRTLDRWSSLRAPGRPAARGCTAGGTDPAPARALPGAPRRAGRAGRSAAAGGGRRAPARADRARPGASAAGAAPPHRCRSSARRWRASRPPTATCCGCSRTTADLWGVGVIAGRRRLDPAGRLDRCLETTRRLQADLRAAAYQPAGALRDAITASLSASLGWLDEAAGPAVAPALRRPRRDRYPRRRARCRGAWCRHWPGVPVTVAPSATQWAGRSRIGPARVEVLAGPGLEHAATEAAAVAAVWPGAGLRQAATSEQLLTALGTAEVVHVAAHGLHRADSPLFSSLRMTDGDVYAHELPAGQVAGGARGALCLRRRLRAGASGGRAARAGQHAARARRELRRRRGGTGSRRRGRPADDRLPRRSGQRASPRTRPSRRRRRPGRPSSRWARAGKGTEHREICH